METISMKRISNLFYLSLKETQPFQAYSTESHKYCIIIAGGNTKISKTYSLLNKMLFSLFALLSVYCDMCFFRLSQGQLVFSSWTQHFAEFLKILHVTSDHSCHCIISRVYNNFNLNYFICTLCISIIESLYKSFSS